MRVSIHAASAMALAIVLCGCAISGAPIDWKLPPKTDPPIPVQPKPRATLAVIVSNASTKNAVSGAIVTAAPTDPAAAAETWPANADGYAAKEINQGSYRVTVAAEGYTEQTVDVIVRGNQNLFVALAAAAVDAPTPLRDLIIHVTQIISSSPGTSTSRAIPDAWCVINAEKRVGDGSGFLHFPVSGPVTAECGAVNFYTRTVPLDPGERTVYLVSLPGVTPVDPPTPAPGAACDPKDNTDRISHACLEAVAAKSSDYRECQRTGDTHACHAYVRAVARALNTGLRTLQLEARWGLITKPSGSNVDGYGEDVVAFLPVTFPLTAKTWQWRGIDIVGGAGLPGARFIAGELHDAIACDGQPRPWCNRTDNLWAPVPQ